MTDIDVKDMDEIFENFEEGESDNNSQESSSSLNLDEGDFANLASRDYSKESERFFDSAEDVEIAENDSLDESDFANLASRKFEKIEMEESGRITMPDLSESDFSNLTSGAIQAVDEQDIVQAAEEDPIIAAPEEFDLTEDVVEVNVQESEVVPEIAVQAEPQEETTITIESDEQAHSVANAVDEQVSESGSDLADLTLTEADLNHLETPETVETATEPVLQATPEQPVNQAEAVQDTPVTASAIPATPQATDAVSLEDLVGETDDQVFELTQDDDAIDIAVPLQSGSMEAVTENIESDVFSAIDEESLDSGEIQMPDIPLENDDEQDVIITADTQDAFAESSLPDSGTLDDSGAASESIIITADETDEVGLPRLEQEEIKLGLDVQPEGDGIALPVEEEAVEITDDDRDVEDFNINFDLTIDDEPETQSDRDEVEIKGDVLREISDALISDDAQSGQAVLDDSDEQIDSSTYSAYVATAQVKSQQEEPTPESLDEHKSKEKAKKALKKIKEKPRKKTIGSGKRKTGFLKRLLYYIVIALELSVFLYFSLQFMEQDNAFWYIPLAFTALLLLQFMIAVKKDWLHITFYMLSSACLVVMFWLLFMPFKPERILSFWSEFEHSRYLFVGSCLSCIWFTLALTDINKKVRFLLTIIGIYGLTGFIWMIARNQSLQALVEYRIFEGIPWYQANPFFVLINGFLPLSFLIVSLYMFFTLFRKDLKNFTRILLLQLISAFLFLSGNLFYHESGYMTPLAYVMQQGEGKDLKAMFTDGTINASALTALHASLVGMLTNEVSVRSDNLSVVKDKVLVKQGATPGSFYFPRSNNLCFLKSGKIKFLDNKGKSRNLVEADEVTAFDITSEGSNVVYAVEKSGKSEIRQYAIGKEKDELLYELSGSVQEISAGKDGRFIVFRSGRDVHVIKGGKTELLKTTGRNFAFSKENPEICYYSAWDENYGSFSIRRYDFEKGTSTLLTFDNDDKVLPSSSYCGEQGKETFIAYVKDVKPQEVWLTLSDGNNKNHLFDGFKEDEKIVCLSWKALNTELLVSTDKRAYHLPLNVRKEKSMHGSYSDRIERFVDHIGKFGFRNVRIEGSFKKISASFTGNDLKDSVSRFTLSAYAYFPEYRNKKYVNLELRKFRNKASLLVPLSTAPFFTECSSEDWSSEIDWR